MFSLYTWLGDLSDLKSLASQESQTKVELSLFARVNSKYLGKLVVPERVDQACIHAVLSDLQRQAHKLMPHEWRPPSHVLLQVGDENLLPFGFMYKPNLGSTERRAALELLMQCMLPSQPTNKQESKQENKHIVMSYDDNDDYATFCLQIRSMAFSRHKSPERRAVTIKMCGHTSSNPGDLVVRLCNDFQASHFTVVNHDTQCAYKDFMFLTKLSARKVKLCAVLPSTWCDFGIVELYLEHVHVPPGISKLVGLKTLILESISEVPDTLKDLSLHSVSLWSSPAPILKRLVTLLANMPSLAEFYLVHNAMRFESIPSELGAMTSLKRLAIHNNCFQGSIPGELGCLTNLDELVIHESRNFMDTSIPQKVLALQHIQTKLHITFN